MASSVAIFSANEDKRNNALQTEIHTRIYSSKNTWGGDYKCMICEMKFGYVESDIYIPYDVTDNPITNIKGGLYLVYVKCPKCGMNVRRRIPIVVYNRTSLYNRTVRIERPKCIIS